MAGITKLARPFFLRRVAQCARFADYAKEIQERQLLSLLKEASPTEYGRKYRFAERLALHLSAVYVGDDQTVMFFGGGVLNHLQSVKFLPVGSDGDAALFDNPRLFKRDFCNRVAQHFCVVKGNRGDHAHFGTGNNVGRIKAPAESHFHNGDVTAGVFKIQQRGGGNRLKFRGNNPTAVQALDCIAHD